MMKGFVRDTAGDRMLPGFVVRLITWLRLLFTRHRLAAHQQALGKILAEHPDVTRVLVFPPSLDWYTQLFQRPQQLGLAFARQGGLVFYLQPTETHWRGARQKEPFLKIAERFYLCNVPLEIFRPGSYPGSIRPVFYFLTWNWKAIYHLGQRSFEGGVSFIYDYVDEIEAFPGDKTRLARAHARLVQTATLVVTTAERLHQQVQPLRPDALLCPNGVEIEHFEGVRQADITPPADLAPILRQGKPIVGYYGALARWFNYRLLAEVAQKRQDLSFVLIGPDYDRTLLPSGLLRLPNIHWLGVKPYSQIPAYLYYFDIATIPFQLNEITHSTSPLKLFEYLAGGKPVVITAMHESMRYEGVIVADGATAAQVRDNFSARLDEALQLRRDVNYLKRLDEISRRNTWDVRARQIFDALDKV